MWVNGRVGGRSHRQTRNLRASAKVLPTKGIRHAGHVKPGSAETESLSHVVVPREFKVHLTEQ
ncbi:Uncharacterized protein FWK35_00023930, partial [Aphis craccivora]